MIERKISNLFKSAFKFISHLFIGVFYLYAFTCFLNWFLAKYGLPVFSVLDALFLVVLFALPDSYARVANLIYGDNHDSEHICE